jgi:hypothetical protein
MEDETADFTRILEVLLVRLINMIQIQRVTLPMEDGMNTKSIRLAQLNSKPFSAV